MRSEGAPSELSDEQLLDLAALISLYQTMEKFIQENPNTPLESFVKSLGIPDAEVPTYAGMWNPVFASIGMNLRILEVLKNNPEMPLKQVGDKLNISRLEDIKYGVGVLRDLIRNGGVKPEHHPLYFETLITSAGLFGDQESDRIINEDNFKNTVFFYGLTATGTHDLNPTPFGEIS